MKVSLKVKPSLVVEVEDDKMTDVFEQLSCAQEVFGEKFCGKCGSDDISFVTRQRDNTFYELKCNKCFAIVPISPHDNKQGTMYVRRYDLDDDKNKIWLKDKGWKRWNKDTESYE